MILKRLVLLSCLGFFLTLGSIGLRLWPAEVTKELGVGAGSGFAVFDVSDRMIGRLEATDAPDRVALLRLDEDGVPDGTVEVPRGRMVFVSGDQTTPRVIFQGSRAEVDELPTVVKQPFTAEEPSKPLPEPGKLTFTNSAEPMKPAAEFAPPDTAADAESGRERQLRDQLQPASLAHNLPKRMIYGQTVRVELALAPVRSGIDAVSQLQNPLEATVVKDIEHSLRMEATLSGEGFRIEQSGDSARTVLPDRSEVWTWHVTPESFGSRMLDLEVFAVLETPGGDLPPTRIRSFATTVDVSIARFDHVKLFLSDTPLAQQILLAVFGSLGSAVGTVMVWLRLQRRAPERVVDVSSKRSRRK